MAGERDRACRRPLEPDQHAGDRRLARPRLADDRQAAAFGDLERDVVDGDVLTEHFAQCGDAAAAAQPCDELLGPDASHRSRRRGRAARGRSALQSSIASGHRGANAQPGGASNADSGWPGIAVNRGAVDDTSGRAPTSAAVYGWRGWACRVADGCCSTIWPAYITTVRSHTAPGEVEVVGDEQQRQAAFAAQLVEDRHHLRLCRDVERGGRLVGEQQRRLGEQGGGDHHTLQETAGQLVRVLPQAPFAVGHADFGQESHRPPLGLVVGHAVVGAQRLGHEVADPPHRVHVGTRVLEDDPDVVAQRPQAAALGSEHVDALEADRALGLGPLGEQTRDGAGGHRLAGSGLADQADCLARVELERDVVQDRAQLPFDGQPDGQPVDLEQRGHERVVLRARVAARGCRTRAEPARAPRRRGTPSRRRTCGRRSGSRSARRCRRSRTARRAPGSGS